MSTATRKFEKEALSLDIDDRAKLAGRLLMSLDEPTESEVERLWLEEAERRLDDYRNGRIQGIPADEVFQRAIAELTL